MYHFSGKDHSKVKEIIKSLEDSFKLTDEGDLSTFLGIDVTKNDDRSWTLSQPYLIDRITKALNLEQDIKVHDTPAFSLLTLDKDGDTFSSDWYYRSLIGMLTHLSSSTRPDIQFAVHQTSTFCDNPMASHAKAVKIIGRCLKRTKKKGIISNPNAQNSFEDWVDTNFYGG